jgi:hypothetical protein
MRAVDQTEGEHSMNGFLRFPVETPMRKTFRALVGTTLVAGFTIASAGAASADVVHKNDCAKISESSICDIWWTEGSNPAPVISDAMFHSYDEVAELIDYKTDGKGLYMRLKWTDGGVSYTKEIYNTGGDGHVERRNYNITEKVVVDIKACQTDDGYLLKCEYADIRA